MARVKRAVNAHKKRRTTLERASGYRGQRSRLYRKAKEQVTHSLVYSYRDRKQRKGDFRKLWIQRINAAARANGHDLQPLHPGPAPGRRRGRPQDPGRPGRQRRRRPSPCSSRPPRPPCPRTSTRLARTRSPPDALLSPPDVGQRPRQGGAEAQPPLGTLRAAALPCRRPEGRRGRARPSPAASSRCSRRVEATERYADLRATPRPAWARRRRPRPRARCPTRVTPAGRRGRLPLPRRRRSPTR